jgi:flagellar hook-associated protein 1 FlgK
MSINALLNIASQSIASNQVAINVTGANIANVNTPGYSRQTVNFSTEGRDTIPGGIDFNIGVDAVKRVYDSYLESRIVDQAEYSGYDEARQEILGRMESVLNEMGNNGLNDLLGEFWISWDALSIDPSSSVARAGVLSAGKNLSSLIRQKGEAMDAAIPEVRKSITYTVDQINTLSSQIADLNDTIRQANVEDGSANDLVDRRMELIKELGGNINISYHENTDHTVNVLISGGMMIVGGRSSYELVASDGDVAFQETPADILNSQITGGRLGGMIEMNDVTLKDYTDRLNVLADGIVSAVNAQHMLGYDEAGVAGNSFFTPVNGARNMSVSAAILADTQKIAASSTSSGGDGENARLIGALNDDLLMNGNTETFNEFYASLVGSYGYDVRAVDRAVERNTVAATQLAVQRETAVGVSLDEEIINLIKYQFGYNAAGKLAKTANEMLDALMSIGQ